MLLFFVRLLLGLPSPFIGLASLVLLSYPLVGGSMSDGPDGPGSWVGSLRFFFPLLSDGVSFRRAVWTREWQLGSWNEG